jgi:hypothetical protein
VNTLSINLRINYENNNQLKLNIKKFKIKKEIAIILQIKLTLIYM